MTFFFLKLMAFARTVLYELFVHIKKSQEFILSLN